MKINLIALICIFLIFAGLGADNNYGLIQAAEKQRDTFTNSIGMKFVYIQPGTFMMGSPSDEKGRETDETQHQVTLTKGYYMGVKEVTVEQWRRFVRETDYKTDAETGGGCNVLKGNKWIIKKGAYWAKPGFMQEEYCPVICVSWNDVNKFIEWLNEEEGTDKYRLPTEAEWEYACRAGSTSKYFFGEPGFGSIGLSDYAWYERKFGDRTHPVSQKVANDWGLFDMHGNVWEWVADIYGDYPSNPVIDPVGSSSGDNRVIRGGSWSLHALGVRSANRGWGTLEDRYTDIGFRLSRTP